MIKIEILDIPNIYCPFCEKKIPDIEILKHSTKKLARYRSIFCHNCGAKLILSKRENKNSIQFFYLLFENAYTSKHVPLSPVIPVKKIKIKNLKIQENF